MIEHEERLIGTLLNGGNASAVFSQIEAAEFKDQDFRSIFEGLRGQWLKRGDVDIGDLPLLPEELMKLGFIANQTAAIANIDVAIESFKTQNALSAGRTIAVRLMEADKMADVQASADELMRVAQGVQKVESANMQQLAVKFMESKNTKKEYIKTGFSRLDLNTFIDKGDYVVIGARPSSGKTALAINMAVKMARQGYKVGFFSLETSAEKIFDRLVAMEARIHLARIKRQTMESHEWAQFAEAVDRITSLPLTIIPTSGKNVAWIQSETLRQGFDIVFIDYLGLIKSTGRDIREQVSRTSRDLHTFAQSSKTLVITLAQLNREGDGKEPSLINLRESGEIEENADLVLLIHNPPSEETYRPCKLIVAKNKDGIANVGDNMTFEGRYQRFTEVDDERTY